MAEETFKSHATRSDHHGKKDTVRILSGEKKPPCKEDARGGHLAEFSWESRMADYRRQPRIKKGGKVPRIKKSA